MKKVLLFCFLGMFLAGLSQENINERCMPEDYAPTEVTDQIDIVGDFTITDSQGVTRNLYDELDLGNTVIIDLFFTT